jgi:hypothetical protein
MRIADLVSETVKDIQNQTKEIKQGDEDDLAALSDKFDSIATLADETATRLSNADNALSNNNGDDEQEEESESQEKDEQQVEQQEK